MPKWDRNGARHLLMRVGLGFVLAWFGIQELRNPSEWAVFVPSFVSDHAPVAVNDLILLHGFLLLVAAAAIVLGLVYLLGCLLAVGLVVDIILGLWLDGGVSDLVIRDIGLLALTGALTIDPARFWHLDNVLPRLRAREQPVQPPAKGKRTPAAKGAKTPPPPPPGPSWPTRAGGAAALFAAVLAVSFILHATGSNVPVLAGGEVASLRSASGPSPGAAAGATSVPGPVAPVASATPAPSSAPASSVRFDDWKYKKYSFQVYPGEVSSDAKKALAGFDLSVQDQGGGKVLLMLKALSTRYKDATFTVDKGNTAYFVETSMRDDPNDLENNLNDDGVVVVDPQGYIHLGS